MPLDVQYRGRNDSCGAAGYTLHHGTGFYRGRLTEQFSINCLIPEAVNGQKLIRLFLKNCVWGNLPSVTRLLCASDCSPCRTGRTGVIFGCTEIGLLVPEERSVLLCLIPRRSMPRMLSLLCCRSDDKIASREVTSFGNPACKCS